MAADRLVDLPNSENRSYREKPHGLFGELLSLLGSVARYLQAYGALAGEESKEALALGLRLVVMLLAALFFAAFGYVLLVIALAFFAAHFLGISWLWILGGFTALHLGLAFVCANHVRTHRQTPLFQATRREIASDLETLQKTPNP